MINKIMKSLTLGTMLMNSTVVFARDGVGASLKPKNHPCDKDMVERIYKNQTHTHVQAELHKRFTEKKLEGESRGLSDAEFCEWVAAAIDERTEGQDPYCVSRRCQKIEPEPTNVDDHRDIVRHTRPVRRVERVEKEEVVESGGGGGGIMSSPFMGGLLGGALGGFLGGMFAGRMTQQQQQMFPQPFGGPQLPPGVLPFPQNGQGIRPFPNQFGGGIPGMQPFPGAQVAPWAQPYIGNGQQQFAGLGQNGYQSGYGYGGGIAGYPGGGFGGYRPPAPSVLPLAPQNSFSPYSVGGSIQQNHWGLINAGR